MRTMIHQLRAFTLTALASPAKLAAIGDSSNREADIAGRPRGARRPFRLIWVTWIAAAALTACGGSGGSGSAPPPPPPPPPTISSIAVAPQTGASSTYTGDTLQLTATAKYSDGSTKDITAVATWASSNSAVATVSASGQVTSLTAGQSSISASLSGVSGSDSLTVNAKALTSIQVSPSSATLAMGLSQQFWAVGTYNDGSTADVTQTATWSSSMPFVATVTGAADVATVNQGATTITATLGNFSSMTQLEVSNATGGPVFVYDLTDSRILTVADTDQSISTFYGSRDAAGNLSSLSGWNRSTSDGKWEQFSLDSQGRLSSIQLSSNSQFIYDWSGSGSVTVITSDGTTAISAFLNVPASGNKSNNTEQGELYQQSSMSKGTDAASTTASGSSLINVHVTSCNGAVPEDFASVTIQPPFGGAIQAALVSPGTGTYLANVASGPPSTPVSQFVKSVSDASKIPCGYVNYVNGACAAVTAAIIFEGSGFPAIYAAEVFSTCAELAEASLSVSRICDLVGKSQTAYSTVDYLSDLNPSIHITTSLLSGSASEIPQGDYESPDKNGVYPNVAVGFPCPPVHHVNVWPSSASINVGQSLPVVATAADVNNKILYSSAFKFDWSSPDSSVVSVVPPSGAGTVGTGTVTGVAPGGPVNITATETSSNKQGTSTVTVLKYSFVALNYPGATITFPMAMNNVGQVVGYWGNPGQATSGNFVYSAGNFSSISTPGTPTGINDNGQIVGTYYPDPTNQYVYHGFLYSGGSYTTIDYPGSTATSASGINASGQIVGSYIDQAGNSQSFLDSAGSFSTIVYPNNPYVTSLAGINTSGQIVGEEFNYLGQYGFVDSSGSFISITDPTAGPSGPLTYAMGINDSGEVAGYYIDQAQAVHGFIYSGGSYTTIDYPGIALGSLMGTQITGINNSGQIIGYGEGGAPSFLGTPVQ